MGAGMARSLAREGHEVVVWNRTRDKAQALAGAKITAVDTVAEAVTDSAVVLTMLFDTDAVLGVADEITDALSPDAVWVQSSTVGPDGIRRIAAVAGDRILDAPMVGTKKPAEDGALVVLVSGPDGLVATAQPVLDAVGSKTVVVGAEIGQASALKLACNAWIAMLTACTAQSLAIAASLDVDPGLFLQVIEGGAVDTPYAHVKGDAMLAGDWATSFPVDGLRKDLGLMVEATRDSGFPQGLLTSVLGLFDGAAEQGHGGEDIAAVRTAFPIR